jgi:cytochrome c peroxidase
MTAKEDRADTGASYLRPAYVPYPPDNAPTAERVALGKALFFDPRLSGSLWISCATCHNPALGWSDGLPTAIGHGMTTLGRATPTILNSAYQKFQFWDGRARTLEVQALGPLEADLEMHGSVDDVLKRLAAIPGYVEMFNKSYPGLGITKDTLAKAISNFERSIVSTESSFDRWRKGDQKAVSESAKHGFELFENKARCSKCHQNFNFSDDGFHNIGLTGNQDAGRFAKVPIRVLKGAMKTPTLRDITLTAPYMHNGAYKTLQDVIEHYNRGGDSKDNIDPNMQPLNLSLQEKADLIEFLKTLTGEPMTIAIPHLPQ